MWAHKRSPARTKFHRAHRLRKKSRHCHSERSEESLFDLMCSLRRRKSGEILRSAQNDNTRCFFRSLSSLCDERKSPQLGGPAPRRAAYFSMYNAARLCNNPASCSGTLPLGVVAQSKDHCQGLQRFRAKYRIGRSGEANDFHGKFIQIIFMCDCYASFIY